jgi:uncharacterized protein YndB with AHSA1/START domain
MNADNYAKHVTSAALEIARTLPASPAEVWQYLVDPELRQHWFCAGETGSQSGEPFVMDFDHTRISDSSPPEGGCGDAIKIEGTIVKYEPPTRLVYDWPGENESSTTRVTITLKADGESTVLHLIHERLTNAEFKSGASAGWHTHLDLLVDLLEGKPARDFWKQYTPLKLEYDSKIS